MRYEDLKVCLNLTNESVWYIEQPAGGAGGELWTSDPLRGTSVHLQKLPHQVTFVESVALFLLERVDRQLRTNSHTHTRLMSFCC